MSTAADLPDNWIYSSSQYASISPPFGENWVDFQTLKDSYLSKNASNPIKLTIDSADAYARLPRHVLSATVQCWNADNTPNTTNVLTSCGLAAIFKRVIVRVGGKVTDDISDYPRLLKKLYKRYPVTKQNFLKYFEGYNASNVFASGQATLSHNIVLGTFHPVNNQPMPLPQLPNTAVEIEIYLNDASKVFVGAAAGSYYTVNHVHLKVQMVTPDAKFSTAAWAGIQQGKALVYDYVKTSQIINSASGGTLGNYQLPLANSRSIIALSHTFVSDNDASDTTKDQALIDFPANLATVRYEYGTWRLPVTNDFTVAELPMISLMSENPNYEDIGFDFTKYYTGGEFDFTYPFQSSDENMLSGMNLVGTNGIIKVITSHTAPVPVSTSMITTVFENRSIIIGREVDVA